MDWSAGAAYQHNNSGGFPNADEQYQHDHNTAVAVMDVGIVVFAAGLGMTIAGAIHDHSKNNNKWSVVAPKRNEMGLAYNF